ncbi:MAG: peptide chain release factor N(5)-glutamine methyltransferase [Tatlockia sp.]|nr:peptide chain release factor N(5)-glutamine methyltransferase [Tatlockia sp.]
MIEIKKALLQASNELIPQESARLEAEILLAHVLMKTRSYLYTHPDALLSTEQWQAFKDLVKQRVNGLPIAYLTGTREFWSLPLKVCKDTLIPRPETELLVELTLDLLADNPQAQILELGTGSGAIALACAFERPAWQITAIDCSAAALKIAEENATRLGLTNINFCLSDWFASLATKKLFDAIITNPPYIAANDPHLLIGDLRFEPSLALVSGDDGLTAIQHIIQHSLERLKPGGLLLLEHGFDQKSVIRSMLNNYGYSQLQCWQDGQYKDRVSGGKRIKGLVDT